MKSFYQLYNTDFPTISANTSTANKTLGKSLINDTQRLVLGAAPWPFLEFTDTMDTVDGQNYYQLPAKMRKITNLKVVVGTTTYRPKPVEDPDFWLHLQSLSTSESDATQYYYREGNLVRLYPAPATDGYTITVRGRKRWKDLSLDDYSTGTIVTATNGDETIVGGSTVWTGRKPIESQWIRIDVTTGDFQWYEISSITDDTNLELVKKYEGVSIASGTETYTMGEFSVIPSEYHDLMLWRSLAIYFMQNEQEQTRADRFWMLYDGGFEAGRSKEVGGLLKVMMDNELEKNEGAWLEPTERIVDDVKRFHIDEVSGESW